MELQAYLERIGYEGSPRVDLSCLQSVHRAHALNIPYENLDVQLGRPLDLNIERIFEKIVINRRGGWCYEMNGLLHWALSEIGFDVTRVNGGVRREEVGDAAVGNHLVLLVRLDQVYLADVGIGDTIRIPTLLAAGPFQQGDLCYELLRFEDGFWRLRNHPNANPESFDFRTTPADESLFEQMNRELQTRLDSNFVENLFCFQMRENTVLSLVGRVLTHIGAAESDKRLISSAEEFEDTIARDFGVIDPDIKSLWPRVCKRHEELFGCAALDDWRS